MQALVSILLIHPVKVHIWAAISIRGPSGIAILDGIMGAAFYVSIFNNALLPFLSGVYSDRQG